MLKNSPPSSIWYPHRDAGEAFFNKFLLHMQALLSSKIPLWSSRELTVGSSINPWSQSRSLPLFFSTLCHFGSKRVFRTAHFFIFPPKKKALAKNPPRKKPSKNFFLFLTLFFFLKIKKRRPHLLHLNDNTWDTWQWMSVLWDTIRHYQGVGRRMSSVATPRMPGGGAPVVLRQTPQLSTQFFCTHEANEAAGGRVVWVFGELRPVFKGRSCVPVISRFNFMFNFTFLVQIGEDVFGSLFPFFPNSNVFVFYLLISTF